MSEKLPYSELEKKYERIVTSYFNLKKKYEALQRRVQSFKDDAKAAERSKKMTEREFRGYLTAGQNSLQSYREIIALCAGRLRGAGQEDFADRIQKYLDNMSERVQPVADIQEFTDILDRMIRGEASTQDARDFLEKVRGYDLHDVPSLSVEADDGEVC